MLTRIKRLFAKAPKHGAHKISDEILASLNSRRSSEVRPLLKKAMENGARFSINCLLKNADDANWDEQEKEKLTAYYEFFSDQAAQGYQRVLSGHLARHDYPLFMTALLSCYFFDRYNEGIALLRQFDPENAEEVNWAEYYAYAGYMTYCGSGAFDQAIHLFDQALEKNLITNALAVNAYTFYFENGRLEQCRQLRHAIAEQFSDSSEAIYAIACVELARDYYPEGFRLAEIRYSMPEVARSIDPALLTYPRWVDQPENGKTLLVHCEQGLGDIVMICRYLPLLCKNWTHVVIDSRDSATTLLQHNFPECTVISRTRGTSIAAQFDYWVAAMSLPWHFKTTANTVPSTSGYLAAPPEQLTYWRTRIDALSDGRLRVGIAWSGNPSHRADRRRSIPFEKIASHIVANPKVQFFALQTSTPPCLPRNLIDVSDEMVTLSDTAALIEQMDLIITVDTSVVHLAGALGKETWLLLPHRYEWRWGLTGESNNWYDSVRVLRQESPGDWEKLLSSTFASRLATLLE